MRSCQAPTFWKFGWRFNTPNRKVRGGGGAHYAGLTSLNTHLLKQILTGDTFWSLPVKELLTNVSILIYLVYNFLITTSFEYKWSLPFASKWIKPYILSGSHFFFDSFPKCLLFRQQLLGSRGFQRGQIWSIFFSNFLYKYLTNVLKPFF